jgi:hypothetical protein
MRYPERHPILGLYARYGTAFLVMGFASLAGGVLAGRHALPARTPEEMSPLHLIWWQHYAWAIGIFFIVFGVALLIYRATIKSSVLLGTRLKHEHDRSLRR